MSLRRDWAMRFPACIALCLALSHTSAYTFAQAPAPTQPVITLQEAIQRGEHNEPNFATARGEAKATALDRSIARAAASSAVEMLSSCSGRKRCVGPEILSAAIARPF